jgi:hypothetical protein
MQAKFYYPIINKDEEAAFSKTAILIIMMIIKMYY